MKKLFFANCVLLMFAFSGFGQTSKGDLEQLRIEIGSRSSISVSRDNQVAFPASKPIKIYLTIKHNKSAAKDFTVWVGQWNRTNAVRYGALQIVDDLESADIAAVQYRFGTTRLVREESVRMKIGKTAPKDDDDDKIVFRDIGNSGIKAESSVKPLRIPIYTYLIVRGRNSSWVVNYSRVDETVSDKTIFPELLLQSAIEERLKKR